MLFYNVVQTSSKISPLLRLLLTVSVGYICQKRIEKYHHRTIKFFIKKYYISKYQLGKEECFCNLCIAINYNLLDKTRTQDKIKCHFQHP